jgi:uncharacterized protein
MRLTDAERETLLKIAREAMAATVVEEEYEVDEDLLTGNLKCLCGVFVTLRTEGVLRGCIGYVESENPLALTVAEVAAKAASEDPRFIPVSAEDLDEIVIEISVLSPMEAVDDYNKIEIGKHGLYIAGEYHRGLLLPQVAVENKWDRETFITQVGRKAGLFDFSPDAPDITLYLFTADVFNEKQYTHEE